MLQSSEGLSHPKTSRYLIMARSSIRNIIEVLISNTAAPYLPFLSNYADIPASMPERWLFSMPGLFVLELPSPSTH